MDNLELINDMYTKIKVSERFKDADVEKEGKKKVKFIDSSLDNDFDIYKKKYNDLDFLYDDDEKPKSKSKDKIKVKTKVEKKDSISYLLYFILFVLFILLNSYYVINFFNKHKISYNTSLIIRSILFLICYYYVKKLIK
jgi:hypothetical protein